MSQECRVQVGDRAQGVRRARGGQVSQQLDGAANIAMTHPALSGSCVAVQLPAHRALHLMLLHST